MGLSKQIVVLSKSRRPGGCCVAGREVRSASNGFNFGSWIRPVTLQGGIGYSDMRLNSGNVPSLLDIVEIPFEKKILHALGQPENYLIASGERWKRVGAIQPCQLPELAENPGTLWGNAHDYVNHVVITWNLPGGQSLYLIKPTRLSLICCFSYGKKRVKAQFQYNGLCYALQVTDPEIYDKYLKGKFLEEEEEIRLSGRDYYLCVSLATELKNSNRHYKLVASIIEA